VLTLPRGKTSNRSRAARAAAPPPSVKRARPRRDSEVLETGPWPRGLAPKTVHAEKFAIRAPITASQPQRTRGLESATLNGRRCDESPSACPPAWAPASIPSKGRRAPKPPADCYACARASCFCLFLLLSARRTAIESSTSRSRSRNSDPSGPGLARHQFIARRDCRDCRGPHGCAIGGRFWAGSATPPSGHRSGSSASSPSNSATTTRSRRRDGNTRMFGMARSAARIKIFDRLERVGPLLSHEKPDRHPWGVIT